MAPLLLDRVGASLDRAQTPVQRTVLSFRSYSRSPSATSPACRRLTCATRTEPSAEQPAGNRPAHQRPMALGPVPLARSSKPTKAARRNMHVSHIWGAAQLQTPAKEKNPAARGGGALSRNYERRAPTERESPSVPGPASWSRTRTRRTHHPAEAGWRSGRPCEPRRLGSWCPWSPAPVP
jgi:hypothetical protein